MAEIVYADSQFFQSFREALQSVAEEKIYIATLEAPSLEKVAEYQSSLIEKNLPAYYLIDQGKVVGWCDVRRYSVPEMSHRAALGMGILRTYRGQGFGSQLLEKAINHAEEIGIEKLELQVYTSNLAAIALYRKFHFVEEGFCKSFRKLEGVTYDCLSMARFFV